MAPDEFLLGSSLWVGENHGGKLGSISVKAYLFASPDHESVTAALGAMAGPIPVREVQLEVTLEEYLGFFKRFAVFNTKSGLNLEGKTYTVV